MSEHTEPLADGRLSDSAALVSASEAISQAMLTPLNEKFTKIPDELLNKIFKSTHRADLLNLTITCKSFTEPAERILWEVRNIRRYAKLLTMDVKTQDMFANVILKQSLFFGLKEILPHQLTAKLPRLQELRVAHKSRDPVDEVDIISLITPSLTYLEVQNGRTNNFLPALSQTEGLEHLIIGDEVDIDGRDPTDLSVLLLTRSSLVTLHAGPLSSSRSFVETVSYQSLTDLRITTPITVDDLTEVLRKRLPFPNLKRLGITAQGVAACLLLSRLPKLESPELDISRVLSPGETLTSVVVRALRTVGTLIKLEELRLSLQHFDVQIIPGMFQPLQNLVLLRKLSIKHDLKPNPFMRDVREFLPLSPICPLTHLRLELQRQRVPCIWIQKLPRSHPQIENLSLSYSVQMEQLSAYFPALERLCLLSPEVRFDRSNM
jgi:hypothetical protein